MIVKPKSSLSTCYLAFGDSRLRALAVQTAARTQIKLHDTERITAIRDRRDTGPSPPRGAKRKRATDVDETNGNGNGNVNSEDEDEDHEDDTPRQPRRSERARAPPATFLKQQEEQMYMHAQNALKANRPSKGRTSGGNRRQSQPPPPPSQSAAALSDPESLEPSASAAAFDSEPLAAAAPRSALPSPIPTAASSVPRAASLQSAPVFHPTLAEWRDPIGYIRSITPLARSAGLAKIVPPTGWQPPFCLDSRRFSFTTRQQNLHLLSAGQSFVESGKHYTLGQFQQLAEQFKQHFKRAAGKLTAPEIESEYWSVVNNRSPPIQVEYGADLDSSTHGSGFEPLAMDGDTVKNDTAPYAGSIGWNLRALPLIRGSLLGLLKEHVAGVSTPWLYVGMLFSTFCWHTEDSYLYSINYLHCGAGKSWYSVSGDRVLAMESALKQHHPHLFRATPNLHHQLVLAMDPYLLPHYGVETHSTVQYPGEFIVTFPAAYHCGFSHGFNVGEAVNFAIDSWLPYGRLALEHYKEFQRSSVIAMPELLVAIAKHQCADLDCDPALLSKELDAMIDHEQAGRTRALELGVRKMEPIKPPELDAGSSQGQGQGQSASPNRVSCAICSEECFLSHVSCPRCKTPAVCLQHIEYACQCENFDRVALHYNLSIKQMQQIKAKIQQQLQQHKKKTKKEQAVKHETGSDGTAARSDLSRPISPAAASLVSSSAHAQASNESINAANDTQGEHVIKLADFADTTASMSIPPVATSSTTSPSSSPAIADPALAAALRVLLASSDSVKQSVAQLLQHTHAHDTVDKEAATRAGAEQS